MQLTAKGHRQLAEVYEKLAWRCVRASYWYTGKVENIENHFETYLNDNPEQRARILEKSEKWILKAEHFSRLIRVNMEKAGKGGEA
ncbi:hypothetical protein [Shewanella algae]|uniref:hypothetical protein n=1 Tax=Shewanella algae TaxID=38313 RepID=UPI0031F47F36